MRKFLQSKGQFFFISLMLIIIFISGLQVLFSSFSEIDQGEAFSNQEDFWFWNVKSQVTRSLKERDCPELDSDFDEIRYLTKTYLAKKGIELRLDNDTAICIGNNKQAVVNIIINMTSENINFYENFTVNT